MRFLSCGIALLLASAASAQPLAKLPMPPMKVVPFAALPLPPGFVSLRDQVLGRDVAPEADPYTEALLKAKKLGQPLVVFVGVKARQIRGVVTVSVKELNDDSEMRIFYTADLRTGFSLPVNTSDRDILEAVGLPILEVRQPAPPFGQSGNQKYAQPEAQDEGDSSSPWLPEREQKRIRELLKGIPLGNVKFYSLEPMYQSLQTTNNGRTHIRNILHLENEPKQFTVSGGMDNIHSGLWRSIKGLDIPEGGKVTYWEELTDVRAFSDVPRWRWLFPVGTIAWDALFNAEGKPFEVRTQIRTETGWKTKILHADEAAAPHGYNGIGQSCSSCHSQTGVVFSVPGRIYRQVRWGDDARFSWRPFLADNKIDHRWPLERKRT